MKWLLHGDKGCWRKTGCVPIKDRKLNENTRKFRKIPDRSLFRRAFADVLGVDNSVSTWAYWILMKKVLSLESPSIKAGWVDSPPDLRQSSPKMLKYLFSCPFFLLLLKSVILTSFFLGKKTNQYSIKYNKSLQEASKEAIFWRPLRPSFVCDAANAKVPPWKAKRSDPIYHPRFKVCIPLVTGFR